MIADLLDRRTEFQGEPLQNTTVLGHKTSVSRESLSSFTRACKVDESEDLVGYCNRKIPWSGLPESIIFPVQPQVLASRGARKAAFGTWEICKFSRRQQDDLPACAGRWISEVVFRDSNLSWRGRSAIGHVETRAA